ncbi:hypothetical protein DFH06DRAFT_240104 [Mycena polygramma]|nr:hypothetical protein DFH06DRAFT_240104 [Mycena polygramma]
MDANPIAVPADPEQHETVYHKDTEYFFENGDCIFEVVGVYFKLHKLFLSRDRESMFPDMFNIPQGSTTEGQALDPIRLSGDTIEDFRALCWALYALPTEIQSQNDPEANIERLVAVARMSNKYCLSSFETWALGIVWIHCRSDRDYLNGCAENMLGEIYEAAAAWGRQPADLCSLVEQKWLSRLRRRDLQLRHALDFGEAHGMQAFLAEAYYQQARDMKALAPKLVTGSEVADLSTLDLTSSQMHRLLSGYCSLSVFWERFSGTILGKTCLAGSVNNHKTMIGDIAIRDPEDPLNILEGLKRTRGKAQSDYCACRRVYVDKVMSGFSIANHFPAS